MDMKKLGDMIQRYFITLEPKTEDDFIKEWIKARTIKAELTGSVEEKLRKVVNKVDSFRENSDALYRKYKDVSTFIKEYIDTLPLMQRKYADTAFLSDSKDKLPLYQWCEIANGKRSKKEGEKLYREVPPEEKDIEGKILRAIQRLLSDTEEIKIDDPLTCCEYLTVFYVYYALSIYISPMLELRMDTAWCQLIRQATHYLDLYFFYLPELFNKKSRVIGRTISHKEKKLQPLFKTYSERLKKQPDWREDNKTKRARWLAKEMVKEEKKIQKEKVSVDEIKILAESRVRQYVRNIEKFDKWIDEED